MIDYLFNLIQIFVVYVITLLAIPVGFVGIIVGGVLAIAAFLLGAVAALLLAASMGAVAGLFLAPIWYLGGPVVRRLGWCLYLWAEWAQRDAWMLLIPPLTTLAWWVPGIVIVPLIGALFATLAHANFIIGWAFGVGVYDFGLLTLLILGRRHDFERRIARLAPSNGG